MQTELSKRHLALTEQTEIHRPAQRRGWGSRPRDPNGKDAFPFRKDSRGCFWRPIKYENSSSTLACSWFTPTAGPSQSSWFSEFGTCRGCYRPRERRGAQAAAFWPQIPRPSSPPPEHQTWGRLGRTGWEMQEDKAARSRKRRSVLLLPVSEPRTA